MLKLILSGTMFFILLFPVYTHALDLGIYKMYPIQDDYDLKTNSKFIGEGSFAKVYTATQLSTGRKVAVKEINLLGANRNLLNKIDREVLLLSFLTRRAKHENIIEYIDSYKDKFHRKIYIVMELIEGTNLFDHIINEATDEIREFDADYCRKVFFQIVEGLYHLEKLGIVHRDLKPQNIMIVEDENKNPKIKIIDFGLSRFINEKAIKHTSVCGSPEYIPPEGYQPQINSDLKKVDSWSLAVIMFNLRKGAFPFKAKPGTSAVRDKIVNLDIIKIFTDNNDSFYEIDTLINSLFVKEEKRKSPGTLKSDVTFNGLDSHSVSIEPYEIEGIHIDILQYLFQLDQKGEIRLGYEKISNEIHDSHSKHYIKLLYEYLLDLKLEQSVFEDSNQYFIEFSVLNSWINKFECSVPDLYLNLVLAKNNPETKDFSQTKIKEFLASKLIEKKPSHSVTPPTKRKVKKKNGQKGLIPRRNSESNLNIRDVIKNNKEEGIASKVQDIDGAQKKTLLGYSGSAMKNIVRSPSVLKRKIREARRYHSATHMKDHN